MNQKFNLLCVIPRDQFNEFIFEKNSSYTGRFPDFPGGMAANVLHDSVAEYAHAGMDEGFTGNFHFRAQSTIKTYTAAAIMLLHQEGKLTNTAIKKGRKNLSEVIDNILEAPNISKIKNLKKLKGHKSFYRIRMGDFRIGIALENDKAILDKVKREPVLVESIKSVYDQWKDTKYFLLGSSQ